ncbi:MAG: hypothetical protein CME25_02940 [Gemmatimonadetes bacterium]|nr:hypothetical protein [Gemmatimonadota bacterium]|tara:strand:- start:2266 stop:2679 length:414 start_codon:yes stop_codon:yes gene_type:complete
MGEFTGFLKQLGIALAGTFAIGSYPLYAYGDPGLVLSVAVGCGICTANVLAGSLSILLGFDKPNQDFLKILFGGMLARMMVIGILVFVLIKLTSIQVFSLILSLFVFYVLFQILEIRFLMRCLPGRQIPKEGVRTDG